MKATVKVMTATMVMFVGLFDTPQLACEAILDGKYSSFVGATLEVVNIQLEITPFPSVDEHGPTLY